MSRYFLVIKNPKKLSKEFEELLKSQLNVKKIEWKRGSAEVKLDTKMTPELEAEGYARNIIRSIQAFRKKLGLQPKDKVRSIILCDKELKDMLDEKEN